ncbi:unnamed protein product [Darwinula stevensoni]|uniref:Cytochrome P450 n=1 Tax=Darwinula stevensoni TaxID=69355 RepID=A0A7R9AIC2_9CRUS|nr:unnamed protein product [Darwinula stevensoni]CAG0906732.1 unnamed protein product [Darwinula stevensoni]
MSSTRSQWRENRGFTLQVLRDFGLGKASVLNGIIEEVLKLCEVLGRNKEEPQSLQHPLNLVIFNIIWKLTAGKQFEHGDPELQQFLDRLTVVKEVSFARRQCNGETLAKMKLFLFVAIFTQKFFFCVTKGHPIPSKEGDGSFIVNCPKPYKFILRNTSRIEFTRDG